MRVTITLPENWTVRTSPAAFSAESDTAVFHASWTSAPGTLTAQLSWQPRRAVLAPSDYAVFQRSVRALAAWLNQPVVLAPADAATIGAGNNGTETADLRDFPILPTGEGQMRLLEQKYPEENSEALRRAALQRVLQWFPQDIETAFTAQVKLALLDRSRDGEKIFATRVRSLLEQYVTQLSAGIRAWGDFLEAKARWAAEKDPAAIKQLQTIADDHSLGAFRRGWSAEAAGRYLREAQPEEAREFLQRHDDYESEARESIVRLIAAIHVDLADEVGLGTWARGLASDHPQVADALLVAAAEEIGAERVSSPVRNRMAAALRQVASDATAFPRTAAQLQQLEARKTVDDAREAFRADLARWLEQHPLAWLTPGRSPRFADAAAAIKSIRENNDAEKPQAVVEDVLQLALYHDASIADSAVYFRWALWWLNKQRFQDDLLEAMGRAILKLPGEADEDVIDCWNQLGAFYVAVKRDSEARAIFDQVLAHPASAKYQITEAGGELALLELRAKNVDAALAAFQRIEPVHTAHKNGADYLYVAVLLRLSRTEHDAALGMLASIQKQEQKYLDGCRHNVAMGHLLRAAQRPEALKRFWRRQSAFRAAWEEVLTSHGVGATGELPLATDFGPLGDRLAKTLAAKDATGFLRELDHFARLAPWVPLFSIDFNTYASRSDAISSELQLALYKCGLVLVEGGEPVDPQLDSGARIWEVALLNDTGRQQEARARARTIVQELGIERPAGENVLRIWVIASRGSPEEAEVTALLAAQLESGRQLHDRLSLLRTLSDSYQLTGQSAVHRQLLEREIKRSDFDPKSEYGRVLALRLDSLRASDEAAQAFSQAVAAWKRRRDVGWIEQIAPASLDDPRFSGLKPPVMQAPEGYARAEIIKFNLLAASDERLSIDIRSQALYSAAFDLAYSAEDIREFAATFTEAAAIDQMPADWRANCLLAGLSTLFRTGQSDLAAEAASGPAFPLMRDELRSDFERASRALARAERGGDNWEIEAFAILAEKPFERLSIGVAERLVRRLAISGEYLRAENLINSAGRIELDPVLNKSSSALRLEWLRLVRSIRERGELLAAFRALLARMPETATARTPRVVHRFVLESPSGLSDAERIALAADFLDRGYLLPEYTRQLLWVVGGARQVATDYPMCFPDLLEMALHSNAPDTIKSEFVSVAALASDVDQPEVLKRVSGLLEEFARSAAATSMPQTQQSVALAQAVHALRTSREKRPPVLYDEGRVRSLPAAARLALQLRFHHARRHQSEALQLLDSADASALTQPEVFIGAREVLRDAGRTPELQLLDESMGAVLRQRIPDMWLTPDLVTGGDWFAVAAALGAKDVFPAAWFDRAVAASGTPARQHSLRMHQAWLTEDWSAMRSAAEEALKVAPDLFDLYYPRALARHRCGNDAGACEDLRVFLRYCLSSEYYPNAVALLNELSPQEVVVLPE